MKHRFSTRKLLFYLLALSTVGKSAHCQITDPVGTYTYAPAMGCPSTGIPATGCYSVELTCPIVQPWSVLVKVTAPPVSIGTVVLTTGGGATQWYESAYASGSWVVGELVRSGFTVVQPNFSASPGDRNGWLQGQATTDGPRHLACRYATVVRFVQEVVNVPQAPLCATGNSNGSAAIGYALSHFGLGDGSAHDSTVPLPGLFFSMVEITSGPTSSRLDDGCLGHSAPIQTPCTPLPVSEWMGGDSKFWDNAWGVGTFCSARDPSHAAQLLSDSIISGDGVTAYPLCDVHVLFGGQDLHTGVAEGTDFASAVTKLNGLTITPGCVGDAAHPLPDALDGAAKIVSDIVKYCKVH